MAYDYAQSRLVFANHIKVEGNSKAQDMEKAILGLYNSNHIICIYLYHKLHIIKTALLWKNNPKPKSVR